MGDFLSLLVPDDLLFKDNCENKEYHGEVYRGWNIANHVNYLLGELKGLTETTNNSKCGDC